jgi:hypothetical protein
MTLPPLTEETAAPGTALNAYDRTVTRDDVRAYVERTGEQLADYEDARGLTVPAGMLLGMYGPLIHGTFHYEAGVHVSSDLQLQRVPRVDEPLRVSGRVVDRFERNGSKYVTFTVEVAAAADGEPLATVVHTSIYALAAKRSG